jgi:hypothetical protein
MQICTAIGPCAPRNRRDAQEEAFTGRLARTWRAGLCTSALTVWAALSAAQDLPTPVIADAAGDAPQPPVIAPVLYAYATLSNTHTEAQSCWQVLIPERELLIREDNARRWLLRNAMPLTGAAMGGVTAGLLLKKHASAAVARRWAVPVILGGSGAGFLLGPGGVAGAVFGAAIGNKLGKKKLPITIAAAAGGALAGKAVWEMVFPPAVPPPPPDDPDDIPVEVFLKDKVCERTVQTSHSQSAYRVAYRFKGEELTAELPYDPGEAVFVGANGEVTGPARVRLD